MRGERWRLLEVRSEEERPQLPTRSIGGACASCRIDYFTLEEAKATAERALVSEEDRSEIRTIRQRGGGYAMRRSRKRALFAR